MTKRMSLDHPLIQEALRRGWTLPEPKVKPSEKPWGKRNKFNAVPTADSTKRRHPSKLQATVTDRIRGEGKIVIPEVSIPLSERKADRIRIDCLVIEGLDEATGTFHGRFVEIKGLDLGEGKQKRRRFEDTYGIRIEVIRK